MKDVFLDAAKSKHHLQSFITTKISTDTSIEDASMFLEKVYKDYSSHSIFTETVRAVRIREMNYALSADFFVLNV